MDWHASRLWGVIPMHEPGSVFARLQSLGPVCRRLLRAYWIYVAVGTALGMLDGALQLLLGPSEVLDWVNYGLSAVIVAVLIGALLDARTRALARQAEREVGVAADADGTRCPHCRREIEPWMDTALCPTCGAVHHLECWRSGDGCGALACAGRDEA